MNKKNGELNKKMLLFVNEYLVHRNATKAAIAAGYSARTAHQAGYRLLRNVEVREKLDAANSQRTERLELSAEAIVEMTTPILSPLGWFTLQTIASNLFVPESPSKSQKDACSHDSSL